MTVPNNTVGARLLNALPASCTQELVQGAVDQLAALKRADDLKVAMSWLVTALNASQKVAMNKILVELDTDSYDKRWLCKLCGRRWGLHDKHTLACPPADGVETDELDTSEE